VAFKFGVAGPFWYATGATIQVLLFVSRRRRGGAAAWALPVCIPIVVVAAAAAGPSPPIARSTHVTHRARRSPTPAPVKLTAAARPFVCAGSACKV
jgi:hypothetical protein